MQWIKKIKSTIENLRSAADTLGKTLWVFFGFFIAIAVASGNPGLLGAIRDRLILAGITSLNTPLGDIDPKQIGQTAAKSRLLGINAANASELAADAKDEKTRQQLEEIAEQLNEQQGVQIEMLAQLAAKQKMANSARGAGTESADMEGWVYLGRRSDNGWRPASFSIGEPAYPVKPGDKLIVKSDTVLYSTVDCTKIDAADFKATAAPPSLVFLTASAKEILISGESKECPSVGGAKTIWAKVKAPAARLFSARQ